MPPEQHIGDHEHANQNHCCITCQSAAGGLRARQHPRVTASEWARAIGSRRRQRLPPHGCRWQTKRSNVRQSVFAAVARRLGDNQHDHQPTDDKPDLINEAVKSEQRHESVTPRTTAADMPITRNREPVCMGVRLRPATKNPAAPFDRREAQLVSNETEQNERGEVQQSGRRRQT